VDGHVKRYHFFYFPHFPVDPSHRFSPEHFTSDASELSFSETRD
jgi:hypothetical protein